MATLFELSRSSPSSRTRTAQALLDQYASQISKLDERQKAALAEIAGEEQAKFEELRQARIKEISDRADDQFGKDWREDPELRQQVNASFGGAEEQQRLQAQARAAVEAQRAEAGKLTRTSVNNFVQTKLAGELNPNQDLMQFAESTGTLGRQVNSQRANQQSRERNVLSRYQEALNDPSKMDEFWRDVERISNPDLQARTIGIIQRVDGQLPEQLKLAGGGVIGSDPSVESDINPFDITSNIASEIARLDQSISQLTSGSTPAPAAQPTQGGTATQIASQTTDDIDEFFGAVRTPSEEPATEERQFAPALSVPGIWQRTSNFLRNAQENAMVAAENFATGGSETEEQKAARLARSREEAGVGQGLGSFARFTGPGAVYSGLEQLLNFGRGRDPMVGEEEEEVMVDAAPTRGARDNSGMLPSDYYLN